MSSHRGSEAASGKRRDRDDAASLPPPAPPSLPADELAAKRQIMWGPGSRRVATVALLVVGVWLLYVSREVIGMLAVAAVLAFVVQPAVRRLTRRGVPQGPAVLLTYLTFLGLVLLALALLAPRLLAQAVTLSQSAWRLALASQERAVEVLVSLRQPVVAGVTLDMSTIVDPAVDAIQGSAWPAQLMPSPERVIGTAQGAIRAMGGLVLGFANVVATVLLTLFFAMRMNLDGPSLVAAAQRVAGAQAEVEAGWLVGRIREAWNAFLLGQLKLSLIVGVMVGVGTLALGLPGALLLGLLAGLLEVLPGIGPIVATIPAIVVALVQGSAVLPLSQPVFALVVALFYVAVQQAENNIIVPRVMGDALRLPPLVVLVAVVIGVRVGGVVGAFVAAPCVATLKILAEYTLAKARGEDPCPELRQPVATAAAAEGHSAESAAGG